MNVNDAMIDAAAAVLRERVATTKGLKPWSEVPDGQKTKWREHAQAMLEEARKHEPPTPIKEEVHATMYGEQQSLKSRHRKTQQRQAQRTALQSRQEAHKARMEERAQARAQRRSAIPQAAADSLVIWRKAQGSKR